MRAPFLLSALFLPFLLAPAGRCAEPWATPFSKDTAAILSAARAATPAAGGDAIVLLDEQEYSFDSAGRMSSTVRKVYRVLTAEGVDDWATAEQRFAPWHERRPELRARVITADGAVHWLDAKTITDAPAVQFDASIFSDSRVLRAPLPAVAVDSVVELEIVSREITPQLKAGSVARVQVFQFVDTRRVHLTVSAAAGVPLRTASRLIPAEATRRTETKSGLRVECDWGPIERKKHWEGSTPFDVATSPTLEFSTAPSWQQVAGQYAALVDERVSAAAASDFGGAPVAGESQRALIARLVSAMHKQVRYTGLELGDASVVPVPPAEVLARRYGDCKDKATLLVSALRKAGLKADVALLLSGFGLDVNPDLPGFGQFNHAIVRVDGSEPLWIDATAQYTRVGDLPAADQGRLALIASAGTTALVKIPESAAKDNRVVHEVEFRLSDFGPAEIRESIQASGALETTLRSYYGSSDKNKVKETLEREIKASYLADSLGEFHATPADDFSQPFRLSAVAVKAGRGITEADQAVAGLFTHVVFSNLPFNLVNLPAEGEKEKDDEVRKQDFLLNEAHQVEYRYRVYYPEIFHPRPLPKDEVVKLGPATFQRSYRQDPSGYVEAVYRFDAARRRYTVAEYNEFRTALRRVLSLTPEMLLFSSATSEALALGNTRKAVELARRYAEKNPRRAGAQASLSRVLISAGAGTSALAAARQAVALDAGSSQAWQALAWACQHDSFGGRFRGNWNAAEAEKAYRKAMEIAPKDLVARIDLAILYEHNAAGDRYGTGARLDQAIALYREALKIQPLDGVRHSLLVALIYAGKYDDAETEIKRLPVSALNTLLAALAHGADRAVLDGQNLFPDPNARATAFLNAGATLGLMRRYELAAELMRAARRVASSPEIENRLKLLSQMKRYEQATYPQDDPRYPLQQLMIRLMAGRVSEAEIRAVLSKRVMAPGTAGLDREARGMLAGLRGRFRALGISSEGVLDAVGVLEFDKQGGDELGYRIYASKGGRSMPSGYVIKEDGQYRLLGTASNPEEIGRLVLELLKANKVEQARRWLDLTLNSIYVPPGQKPSTEPVTVSVRDFNQGNNPDETPAVCYLWDLVPGQTLSVELARMTAASLIASYTASDEAISMLTRGRVNAANRTEKGNIDLALCQAYVRAKKWPELLLAAKRLNDSYAVADKCFWYTSRARLELKQWDELEQDAATRLKSKPDSVTVLKTVALAMLRADRLDKAGPYVEKLARLAYKGQEERNLEAWHAILTGKLDEKLIEEIQKEKGLAEFDPASDFTTGLLEALAGRPEDAQRHLSAALDLSDWALLDARAWVLQGRIQELYGNPDAAQAAYAEARKQPGASDEARWALRAIPEPKK